MRMRDGKVIVGNAHFLNPGRKTMEGLVSSTAVRLVSLVLLAMAVVLGPRHARASEAIASLAKATPHGVGQGLARLSPTPIFDSREHPNVAVSLIGSLSRGKFVHDERVVLLDGRTLLFINPWTGELWTAGGQGEGPGEFAGSGLELSLFRGQDELRVWDPNNDRRLTMFSDTGELQDTRRVNLSGVAFRHWTASMMGVFPDGSFAFIDREPPPIIGASDGRQRTLGYIVEVNEEGKRRVIAEFLDSEGGSVLFRYRTVISFDGDRVSVADTESDEIRIIDRSGRTVSRIPMPGRRVRVSSAQLDAARAEAQVRSRRGDEATLRQLEAMGWPTTENVQSRERDYLHNEVAPSVDRTQFDADKRLWIKHYVMPGDETTRWTVWGSEQHVFSLEMPAGYSLLDARGDLVLLRVRDSLGVDRAEIRRLVWG